MNACSSKRLHRKVFRIVLALLCYLSSVGTGGMGHSFFVRTAPLGNNFTSTIETAVEMVSPAASPDLMPPDGNQTLVLEFNGTLTTHELKRGLCRCWNSTDEFLEEVQCRCEGRSILKIPQKLTSMQKLILEKVGIKRLRENALAVYADELRDLFLMYLREFHLVEPRAFSKLRNLRTLYIAHAPKLQFLEANVFEGISSKLKTLRIINCGLLAVPDMRMLSDRIILHMVDLDGNHIQEIHERAIRIKTDELILDNNALSQIHGDAFTGSELAKLSLKLNFKLKHIHQRAFVGIQNIRELDLSSTAIEDMPSDGLNDLEILRIQNTHSLKTIPSVYNFKNLQTAYLTHSFHCCAFKFPARHDPSGHQQDLRRFHQDQKNCIAKGYATPNVRLANLETVDSTVRTGEQQLVDSEFSRRRKRHASLDEQSFSRLRSLSPNLHLVEKDGSLEEEEEQQGIGLVSPLKSELSMEGDSFFQPITGSPMEDSVLREDVSDMYIENPLPGVFHQAIEPLSMEALCGNLTPTTFDVKCYPMPDALNPCEDVMGSHWLRGSVWVVVLLAVFGNVAVLVVLFSNSDLTVPKFLICNLAIADLCMGVYLLLIASIDAHSMGEYFNYAFDWQYGSGCKVAGFLTVFASHLSIFTLTIVTLERWFAITHAIYLNRRIKLSAATYIMITGWIYSFVMAALPLFGISNYSSTSICLPMEARDSLDIAYLLTVLGINGLAFVIIVICYAQIYFSLGKETRHVARTAHAGEMTVAKKMALLVFTNFACWAPIAFFGLTAIAGYPLIDVTKSKILLVFFYPLNSCANPYLYAITTVQYRRDLFMLLSNYGFCTQRAQQYKMTYSLPTNTIQIAPARGSITATFNSNTCGTVISNAVSASHPLNNNFGSTELYGASKTVECESITNGNGHANIVEVIEEERETFL
ncbi:thyrotropin receptor isoform X2 [Malaya genurostris]|uniref:thyrotropin receptor isoform X2 n=1 Tax=Malaya genurostris TaxID=325434 RepID=UPI0026F3A4C8|nr:thyrotropin receptor isoform X2 [Malaya genurostris]